MNESTRANRPANSKAPAQHFVQPDETPVRPDPLPAKTSDGWASRLGDDYAIAPNGSETRESWAGF